MPDPTPNLGLERPDFNIATWHDQVNGNFTILDAAVAGLVNIVGLWDNSVSYIVGDFVVDSTDSTIWECLVSHTSSSTGIMAADRAANPTYWQLSADIATLVAAAEAAAISAQASAAEAEASAIAAEAAAASIAPNIINLSDFGAVGDGVTDDSAAIQAWVEAGWEQILASDPIGATTATGNEILYAPPGTYRVATTIQINGGYGGRMYGAGRFATHFLGDPDVTVFRTNGCAYCTFADFYIKAQGDASCFELYWQADGYISLQSNTFSNLGFENGTQGLDIGYPNMGSENLVLNCFFIGHSSQGIKTSNFNALQNTVIGGNISNCPVGILVGAGSVPNVVGTGFQNNGWDIDIQNGSDEDSMVIDGCRTESDNFVRSHFQHVTIIGCAQVGGDAGTFLEIHDRPWAIISSASEIGGVVYTVHGVIISSTFGNSDPFNDSGSGKQIRFFDLKFGGETYLSGWRDSNGLRFDWVTDFAEITAAGSVDADEGDLFYINKTVGAATTVNLPPAGDRPNYRPIKVVDGKLDAATNNITIVPDGVETILGLASWVIRTNGGSVTLWSKPDNSGWYIA